MPMKRGHPGASPGRGHGNATYEIGELYKDYRWVRYIRCACNTNDWYHGSVWSSFFATLLFGCPSVLLLQMLSRSRLGTCGGTYLIRRAEQTI